MKVSESWLREYVDFGADTKDLVARLTMAGLEVDSTSSVAGQFSGVVVGKIVSCEAHREAKKLKVCQVTTDHNQSFQVVCGAPNARAGLKVAFATVGARLPDGSTIGLVDLRGVQSYGMLCSAAELELSDDDGGIIELPDDARPGEDLKDYLELNDNIIDIDLTPNRGDCLSLLGLARETAVLYETDYSTPPCTVVSNLTETTFPVSLSEPLACSCYVGRVIENIDNQQASPIWLQEKLRRSGIRSVNPVVDVTNYVMLELGQPLHAFDHDQLKGCIDVRYAREQERLTLLGGSEIELNKDTLVIADQNGALALAGIMGGAGSGTSLNTNNIFLESAHFNPLVIAGKARQYALNTDSSHRFERGVDPELPHRAIERATALLLDIVGGQPGPTSVSENISSVAEKPKVMLRKARLSQQLKLDIADGFVTDTLGKLGIEITENSDQGWLCQMPSWRFDLAIEADLIEEIARIYGYDKLPTAISSMPIHIKIDNEQQTSLMSINRLMITRGYIEAITYSFVDEQLQKLVSPNTQSVALLNPISADMGVMRNSLIPGLLLALKYNLSRQQEDVRLFEAGQRFVSIDIEGQEDVISGVITGRRYGQGWSSPNAEVDFYDVKGDVEALLSLTGALSNIRFEPGIHTALQPGQSLSIIDSSLKTAGYVGKLHPDIVKKLDLDQNIFVFELELKYINSGALPKFVEITRFPKVNRDISIIVDQSVSYAALREAVEANAGDLLSDLKVFDVYQGKHIENNRKSVALSLTFQLNSRTLTDQEVQSAVDSVVSALAKVHSATLRG
jgi:phenylalanyl-tRNA synthetase beta chain